MKKANITLDGDSTGLTIIEKMDFEGIDAVHDALCFAFYPDGIDGDDQIDNRFISLWYMLLASTGWTEDEYWEEQKAQSHSCPDCGNEMHANEDDLDEDEEESLKLKELPVKPISKAN